MPVMINRLFILTVLVVFSALAFSHLLAPVSPKHVQQTSETLEVGPGENCPLDYESVGNTTSGGTICNPFFTLILAADTDPGNVGGPGGGEGSGDDAIGKIEKSKVPLFDNLGDLVADFITLAFLAAAIFFLVQVIIGGISWINAGGDPKALEAARARITNAVIGLVIVVAAFAVSLIMTTVLGINIFGPEGVTIP